MCAGMHDIVRDTSARLPGLTPADLTDITYQLLIVVDVRTRIQARYNAMSKDLDRWSRMVTKVVFAPPTPVTSTTTYWLTFLITVVGGPIVLSAGCYLEPGRMRTV